MSPPQPGCILGRLPGRNGQHSSCAACFRQIQTCKASVCCCGGDESWHRRHTEQLTRVQSGRMEGLQPRRSSRFMGSHVRALVCVSSRLKASARALSLTSVSNNHLEQTLFICTARLARGCNRPSREDGSKGTLLIQ